MTKEDRTQKTEVQIPSKTPDWLHAANVWIAKHGIGEIGFDSISEVFETEFEEKLHSMHLPDQYKGNEWNMSPDAELAMSVVKALTNVLSTDVKRRGPYPEVCRKLKAFRESCIALQLSLFGDEGILKRELSHARSLEKVSPHAIVGGTVKLQTIHYRKLLEPISRRFETLLTQIIRISMYVENAHRMLEDPAVTLGVNSEHGDCMLNQFCYELSEAGIEIGQIAEIVGDIDTNKKTDSSAAWERYVDSAIDRVHKRIQRYRKKLIKIKDS